jgi:hypothetical protein
VNASFSGVTSTSDSDAWAVGSENAELNGVGAEVLIDHWNGTARSQVATTPGAAIVQAAGFSGSSGAENPLAEQNG